MILTLKNIGKIEKATVELNGITIIAGENNTGKSTVGKTLFCIFNSFYKIEEQIQRERKNAINRILTRDYSHFMDSFIMELDIGDMVDDILRKMNFYKENPMLLEESIIEFFFRYYNRNKNAISEIDIMGIKNSANKVHQIIMLSDEEIFKTVLSQKLNSEFNGQINNIYSPGDRGIIELNIKGTNVEISVEDNEVTDISENLSLNTEVVYIDDPFVLDDISPSLMINLRTSNYNNHRIHLKSKLRNIKEDFGIEDAINKIIVSNKIDDIFSKINNICSGEMIKTSNARFGYKESSSDKVLDIKNISTGLKTFVILKTLLLNGSIQDNGTIVLDEPEIHLHPEWQILFAEIIVLLQKEFNMHILLNTHSPYFLRAIQVYSAKYEIADKCNYYLAQGIDDRVTIRDVTTSIDVVYAKLAKPFEILEMEKYGDD